MENMVNYKISKIFERSSISDPALSNYLQATYLLKQFLEIEETPTDLWYVDARALALKVKSREVYSMFAGNINVISYDTIKRLELMVLERSEGDTAYACSGSACQRWASELMFELISAGGDIISEHGKEYLVQRRAGLPRMLMEEFSVEDTMRFGKLNLMLPILLLRNDVTNSVKYSSAILRFHRERRIGDMQYLMSRLLIDVQEPKLEVIDTYIKKKYFGEG